LKVWDASSGKCLWTGCRFPDGETAAFDEVHGRILFVSPGAWRWLGWQWTDPETGRLRILPAEFFPAGADAFRNARAPRRSS
jgi:hypothetical protein